MKRSLDAIFEEIIKLGIDFEKLNSSRSVVEDVPKRKVSIFVLKIYFIFRKLLELVHKMSV